ncbi:MAG: CHAD domain-containing protein [bacterium]
MKARPIDSLDSGQGVRSQLPEIFVIRMNELWDLSRHMQFEDRVTELHDMRIAAKRLRYCFEFFEPLFADGFKAHLKQFKQLQDFLGEIHDCDVWVDYLRDELKLAMQELSTLRRELDQHFGASQGLAESARRMEEQFREGPVSGLLRMLTELTQRRRELYQQLLIFWQGLEEQGFQQQLARDVAEAASQSERTDSGDAPRPEDA